MEMAMLIGNRVVAPPPALEIKEDPRPGRGRTVNWKKIEESMPDDWEHQLENGTRLFSSREDAVRGRKEERQRRQAAARVQKCKCKRKKLKVYNAWSEEYDGPVTRGAEQDFEKQFELGDKRGFQPVKTKAKRLCEYQSRQAQFRELQGTLFRKGIRISNMCGAWDDDCNGSFHGKCIQIFTSENDSTEDNNEVHTVVCQNDLPSRVIESAILALQYMLLGHPDGADLPTNLHLLRSTDDVEQHLLNRKRVRGKVQEGDASAGGESSSGPSVVEMED